MSKKTTAEKTPFNVAIAGTGSEAQRIARGYRDAGINIKAVWDEQSKDFADELEVKNYDSLDSLLADSQVNAVEIVTSLDRRAEDAIKALNAGKAVSVRAPVAANIDDAEKLAQAANVPGAEFRYLDPQHHHAPHALGRKLALKGEIGILNGITVKVAAKDVEPISLDGIDEPLDRLAIMQWIMGPAAEAETMRNESSSVSIIRFAAPHKFGNFEALRSPGLEVPFADRPWNEYIEITGTSGIIWINGFWGPIADRPPVVMRRFKRMINFGADIITDPLAAYKRSAWVFKHAIQNDEILQPGIDEAFADLKLLLAAAESAVAGGRVKIG